MSLDDPLYRAASAHRTLSEVVTWAVAHTPPHTIVAVVVQDEFTHDVVVSAGARWLVYDTT